MSKERSIAITIVDVQNDFFSDPKMDQDKSRLVERINELTQVGRSNNIPIIWVRQEFKDDLSNAYLGVRRNSIRITIEGETGSQLLSQIEVGDDDYHVVKNRYSAFFNTELHELLDTKGIKILLVAGVKTHSCVRMTVVDAYQNDYDVIIATDCLANVRDIHDDITIKFLTKHIATAMTNDEIFKLIAGSKEKLTL